MSSAVWLSMVPLFALLLAVDARFVPDHQGGSQSLMIAVTKLINNIRRADDILLTNEIDPSARERSARGAKGRRRNKLWRRNQRRDHTAPPLGGQNRGANALFGSPPSSADARPPFDFSLQRDVPTVAKDNTENKEFSAKDESSVLRQKEGRGRIPKLCQVADDDVVLTDLCAAIEAERTRGATEGNGRSKLMSDGGTAEGDSVDARLRRPTGDQETDNIPKSALAFSAVGDLPFMRTLNIAGLIEGGSMGSGDGDGPKLLRDSVDGSKLLRDSVDGPKLLRDSVMSADGRSVDLDKIMRQYVQPFVKLAQR